VRENAAFGGHCLRLPSGLPRGRGEATNPLGLARGLWGGASPGPPSPPVGGHVGGKAPPYPGGAHPPPWWFTYIGVKEDLLYDMNKYSIAL